MATSCFNLPTTSCWSVFTRPYRFHLHAYDHGHIRTASHHPPPERRRSSPGSPRRRRASSPASHSTSPGNSRQSSPTRRLRLGSHSIGSPRSPHRRSRTRHESPEKRHNFSRSRSNSPRRRSPRRSITPDKDLRKDNPSAVNRERSPSLPRNHDEELKLQRQSHIESRPRTPAKADSVIETIISNDPPPSPQGNVKEEPPTATETDGDVKMREPSPPLPTGPRSSLPAREPPKGPRGFVQPPTGPAARLPPIKPDWSRNTPQSALGPSFARADLAPSPQTAEPAVTVSLPTIPVFKSKTSLNSELEAEVRSSLGTCLALPASGTHIIAYNPDCACPSPACSSHIGIHIYI